MESVIIPEKLFAAFSGLFINLAGRHIGEDLDDISQEILKQPYTRKIAVFTLAWMYSRCLKTAVMVLLVYTLLVAIVAGSKKNDTRKEIDLYMPPAVDISEEIDEELANTNEPANFNWLSN